MTYSVNGPGLLFVRSRIAQSAKTILDKLTFLEWYDSEHIPEIVATSGIESGFRYIDVHKTSPYGDASNPKPFLAFYPMEDLAFTMGDEFSKIAVQSEKLPGTGIVYDLADFDVSYLRLKRKTERVEGEVGGPAKYLLTCGIRPSQPPLEAAMTSFFSEQTALLAQTPGYLRTLTFNLLYTRTNAQARALKGLPMYDNPNPESEPEPEPEPPTWLAVHEFVEQPNESLMEYVKWNVKELETGLHQAGRWVESEVFIWGLASVHGKGKQSLSLRICASYVQNPSNSETCLTGTASVLSRIQVDQHVTTI